jgi:hypothetical protein
VNQIAKYDEARRALEAATQVDEIASIRDGAAAMRELARRAGDREIHAWCTDIVMRAEWKAGRRLREMAATGERCVQGDATLQRERSSLKDLGVTEIQSHRWQKRAGKDEKELDALIGKYKAKILGLFSEKDSELVQQSLSSEHYTPARYVAAARRVMGGIDLDPASCAEANEIVKAKRFYSEDENGLEKEWPGRIWLNPPYGGKTAAFIEKLIDETAAGHIAEATVLVNAHCTDAAWFRALWDGLLCFTDHRINFYGDEERSGSTHGSVFAYFGPNQTLFVELFSEFGAVVRRAA